MPPPNPARATVCAGRRHAKDGDPVRCLLNIPWTTGRSSNLRADNLLSTASSHAALQTHTRPATTRSIEVPADIASELIRGVSPGDGAVPPNQGAVNARLASC